MEAEAADPPNAPPSRKRPPRKKRTPKKQTDERRYTLADLREGLRLIFGQSETPSLARG